MKCHAVTLLLSLLLVSGPFVTAHADEAPQQVVRVADLDLHSDAGVHKLYARIQRAAQVVCEMYDLHTLESMPIVRGCRAGAVTGAILQLNVPALTRYHAEQSGQEILVVRR